MTNRPIVGQVKDLDEKTGSSKVVVEVQLVQLPDNIFSDTFYIILKISKNFSFILKMIVLSYM